MGRFDKTLRAIINVFKFGSLGEASLKKRIEYIDLYKGIGIMLMIMAHVNFWGQLDHFIHAFHMPMFFVASGYLYQKKSSEELSFGIFLLKKSKSMLIPYFVFGIINFIVFVILEGFSVDPLIHLIFINNHGVAIAGALWFITALLIAETVYFLLDRYCSEPVKLVVIAALAVFGCVVRLVLPFTLPWSLGAAMVGVFFYQIGIWCRRYDNKLFSMPTVPMGLIFIIISVVAMIVPELNMRNEEYGIIPFSIVDAVVLSVLLLLFCYKVDQSRIGNKRICNVIKNIGESSIVYLCLNQLAITFLKLALDGKGINKNIEKIIVYILAMIVLYVISKLITSSKLKVLIGKF